MNSINDTKGNPNIRKDVKEWFKDGVDAYLNRIAISN